MSENNQFDWDRAVAALAYRYWQEEGRPSDRAEQHWTHAEQELRRYAGNPADEQASGGIPADTGASGKLG